MESTDRIIPAPILPFHTVNGLKRFEIIWMLGLPGAGKTSVARVLQSHIADCRVLHIGEICREIFSEAYFASLDKEAAAPGQTEQFVRGMVAAALSLRRVGETLIVESFPKSMSQIPYMPPPDDKQVILTVCCSDGLRRNRVMKNRSEDAIKMFEKANEHLMGELPLVATELKRMNYHRMYFVNA